MAKINLILLITLTLASSTLFAQDEKFDNLKEKKKEKYIERLFEAQGYFQATETLLPAVEKNPQDFEKVYLLAKSYFLARDYRNAEIWFLKADALTESNFHPATYYLAQSQKYNGKYAAAYDNFVRFNKYPFDPDLDGDQGYSREMQEEISRLQAFAVNDAASCLTAQKLVLDTVRDATVMNLGPDLNSGYTDFAPVRMPSGGGLMFASLQTDSVIDAKYGTVKYPHVKLYTSAANEGGWSAPTEMPEVNYEYYHSANGSFSADGSRFYFTKCEDDEGGVNCKILVSKLKDGVMQRPSKVDGDINGEGRTNTMPHLTTVQGRLAPVEVLYFVSDREEDGFGGRDIWFAEYDAAKDRFLEAKNCGPAVNTMGDEVSPFYHADYGNLYFSSNYHHGLGGFDIFRLSGNGDQWSDSAKNVGIPYNSSWDDTYYTVGETANKGFLVTNRPGSITLKNETCCDDIFSFETPPPTLLKVIVMENGKERPDALVRLEQLRISTDGDTSKTKMETPIYINPMLKDQGITENPKNMFVMEGDRGYLLRAALGKEVTNEVMFQTDRLLNMEEEPLVRPSPDGKYLIAEIELRREDQEKKGVDSADMVPPALLADGTKTDSDSASASFSTINTPDKRLRTGDGLAMRASFAPQAKAVVHFDFDKSMLIEMEAKKLELIFDLISVDEEYKVDLAGHTDSKGTEAYNKALSKRRAREVADYLNSRGVPDKHIRISTFGESVPVAPNTNADGSDNPTGRAENRRVEADLLKKAQIQ